MQLIRVSAKQPQKEDDSLVSGLYTTEDATEADEARVNLGAHTSAEEWYTNVDTGSVVQTTDHNVSLTAAEIERDLAGMEDANTNGDLEAPPATTTTVASGTFELVQSRQTFVPNLALQQLAQSNVAMEDGYGIEMTEDDAGEYSYEVGSLDDHSLIRNVDMERALAFGMETSTEGGNSNSRRPSLKSIGSLESSLKSLDDTFLKAIDAQNVQHTRAVSNVPSQAPEPNPEAMPLFHESGSQKPPLPGFFRSWKAMRGKTPGDSISKKSRKSKKSKALDDNDTLRSPTRPCPEDCDAERPSNPARGGVCSPPRVPRNTDKVPASPLSQRDSLSDHDFNKVLEDYEMDLDSEGSDGFGNLESIQRTYPGKKRRNCRKEILMLVFIAVLFLTITIAIVSAVAITDGKKGTAVAGAVGSRAIDRPLNDQDNEPTSSPVSSTTPSPTSTSPTKVSSPTASPTRRTKYTSVESADIVQYSCQSETIPTGYSAIRFQLFVAHAEICLTNSNVNTNTAITSTLLKNEIIPQLAQVELDQCAVDQDTEFTDVVWNTQKTGDLTNAQSVGNNVTCYDWRDIEFQLNYFVKLRRRQLAITPYVLANSDVADRVTATLEDILNNVVDAQKYPELQSLGFAELTNIGGATTPAPSTTTMAPSQAPITMNPTLAPIVPTSTASITSSPSAMPSTVSPTPSPTQMTKSPTRIPSHTPTTSPTSSDSTQSPVKAPTRSPSTRPMTPHPTPQPTQDPTQLPSLSPEKSPSSLPSISPSLSPTIKHSNIPSFSPSGAHSEIPSYIPTALLTSVPSFVPSLGPSREPSAFPSFTPSVTHSAAPSFEPTPKPSAQPTTSPTSRPSSSPITSEPSSRPTTTISTEPSIDKSICFNNYRCYTGDFEGECCPTTEGVYLDCCDSRPSDAPVFSSSSSPSPSPSPDVDMLSASPSSAPTNAPTPEPTPEPTPLPTNTPSDMPSASPSSTPTNPPTPEPTPLPTDTPSDMLSASPSSAPTNTPTPEPTPLPTDFPTPLPTDMPTYAPFPVSEAPTSSLVIDLIYDVSPASTLVALEDPSSPQSEALHAVASDPNATQRWGFQVVQEFALLTYAFQTIQSGGERLLSPEHRELVVTSWPYAGHDVCEWIGVFCDYMGRVIAINVAQRGLPGRLVPEWSLMNYSLQLIDTTNNELEGGIPEEYGDLSFLRWFRVSKNSLTGNIPTSFKKLKNLMQLYMQDNSLSGDFPNAVVADMTSLTSLRVYFNNFTGSINNKVCELNMPVLEADCSLPGDCVTLCL